MKKLLFILLATFLTAKTNISLAKTLLQFQGDEYNILLAPKEIVVVGRKRKTKKAINKGYKRAISELKRQIRLRDIDFHLKVFTPKGSDLPQYRTQDIQAYKILKEMLKQQIAIRQQLFKNTEIKKPKKVSAKDIGLDDIGDDAFDISNDKVKIKKQILSPAEAFIGAYTELSELYNQEVTKLSDVLHPFNINGKPVFKHVHSVFGMAFFPTKVAGSIHMIKIYIVLCNINTESDKSVQIIAKEIPPFEWDRNYLYINAATGKVLRQIISGVLGENF